MRRLPARPLLWLVVCCTLVVLLGLEASSLAATPIEAPYFSYMYDYWTNFVPAPQAYLPDQVYDGSTLGVGALQNPLDLFVAPDRRVYLADTGNNRVIFMDRDYKVLRVVTEFSDDTTTHRFNKPEGIFVTDSGEVYIADTGNGRIVVLDRDANFLRIVGPPEAGEDIEGLLPDNFVYRPRKLIVTHSSNMYVIALDVYDGLLKFDAGGKFAGYIGAPRVAPTLWERFWSIVATEEQKERRALFLPIEYSNIDLDQKGLIMSVVKGVAQKESIKRLNQSGSDVLVRAGFYPPIGDMLDRSTSVSHFTDVAAREAGTYTVLDREYGRVFTYDALGNLLYVFGGLGDAAGLFRLPVAVDSNGIDLIVLDSAGNFTVFKPTQYGRFIHAALMLYDQGMYDKSTEMWKQVLKLNSNYDKAYSGIGQALLRQGDYEAAMAHFQLGQDRGGYSDAFGLFRESLIQERGGQFGTVVIVVILCLYFLGRSRAFAALVRSLGASTIAATSTADDALPVDSRSGTGAVFAEKIRGTARSLRYSLHLLGHPGDGFWELKYEQRGSLSAAIIILGLVILTGVIHRQYAGFVFNTNDLTRINLLMETLGVVIPFILWCGVNWALTTLMEGKGTFKEIVIASAYSMVPFILVLVLLTVLSRFLRAEEGGLYTAGMALASGWTALMLFVGTMITHEYSLAKTAGTTVLIIAGIGVVLFIGLLFSTVINHMIVFILNLYFEAVFR